MRKGIVRSENRQRERSGDGWFELSRVTQRTHQAVMRFYVRGIGGEDGTKRLDCFMRRAGCKQIEPALRKHVGGRGIGRGHGFL